MAEGSARALTAVSCGVAVVMLAGCALFGPPPDSTASAPASAPSPASPAYAPPSAPAAPARDLAAEPLVQQMKAEIQQLRNEILDLRAELRSVRLAVMDAGARPTGAGAVPAGWNPTKPPAMPEKPVVPPAPPTDSEVVGQWLVKLRQTDDWKAVAAALRSPSLSRVAAPFLLRELRGDQTDAALRTRARKVLENLDPAATAPLVCQALSESAEVRVQAMGILAALGERSSIPALDKFLAKPSETETYFYAADALARLRHKKAVPVLISFLRNPDEMKRTIAFNTLRATTGMSNGYRIGLNDPKELDEAVKKWEIWWKIDGPEFEFPE